MSLDRLKIGQVLDFKMLELKLFFDKDELDFFPDELWESRSWKYETVTMFLLSAQQFTQKLLSFAGCLKLHNIGVGENMLSVNHFYV